MRFDELNLNDNILDALDDMRFETCTPIQEKCIPEILDGRDLIGVAQTGTGKTAAYLLPVSINGFLPGQDFDSSRLTDASPSLRMTLPMLLLSLFVLLGGMFPSRIIDLLSSLAAAVLR